MSTINRRSTKSTDDWLTPPDLVKAAGPFDLDPCCHPGMPWRTARKMMTLGHAKGKRGKLSKFVSLGDGLTALRTAAPSVAVWLNYPYSQALSWITTMVKHGNGLVLGPAKSMETRWCQLLLKHSAAALFFDRRLLFYYPDGRQSTGGWSPSLLAAVGQKNVKRLERVQQIYPGAILYRGRS